MAQRPRMMWPELSLLAFHYVTLMVITRHGWEWGSGREYREVEPGVKGLLPSPSGKPGRIERGTKDMSTLEALLRAIVADPQNEDRYLVLADYLEEHDDPRRATLLRLHRRLLATCCEPERFPERADWHARIVELIGQGVRPCVPTRSVVLAEGVDMMFNFVPPGTFLMGSPEHEEWRDRDEYQHQVTLTKGFWLGTFPVTQEQWRAVMEFKPSCIAGDLLAVGSVGWEYCWTFCRRLGEGYRLPTEAEWEWACRAGTTTPYYTGEWLWDLKRAGWCRPEGSGASSKRLRQPVGSLEPNAWGLYDMHGCVSEWCQDWYGPYPRGEVVDPQGPADGLVRVLRGGSWDEPFWACRSAYRSGTVTNSMTEGFRVVLSSEPGS